MYKLVLLGLLFCNALSAQKIDSSFFETLLNKDILAYKDSKGNELGCNAYECNGIRLIFYDINVNKENKTIKLSGRALHPIHADSSGVVGIEIFTGKVKGRRVKHIKTMGYGVIAKNPRISEQSPFPYRTGDFKTIVPYKEGYNLYFMAPMKWLIEYDLGKLFVDK
jgi:hypothetical protein